uniref:protein SOSEKI 5-like n=1 Tax=Erigeron canadensis TaxID=72917 RepID=UPI001CB8ECCA|nr:protein SOSEKI 5-like [Erigeron canadensis]
MDLHHHHMSKRWSDQQLSPDRTKVWIEPPHKKRRVPVVYYLCRNGQLEHPHFIEVPLSSPDGLYLRDVIYRLNSLRGKGMAALYSWSSKRTYRSGFVWHDLSENDFIYPAHGHEYILKGSELVYNNNNNDSSFGLKSDEAMSKKTSLSDINFSVNNTGSGRNQSWTGIDDNEYKVYSGVSSAVRVAATQTSKNRRRRASVDEIEISPPPSDSSTETLESLMKSDGSVIVRSEEIDDKNVHLNPTVGNKMKASSVLMQLITCGSISFRDCGPGEKSPCFAFDSGCKSRMMPRGEEGSDRTVKIVGEGRGENGVTLVRKNNTEDKEYFSGSLIQTKKDEFPALKRSNSYNANG